MGPGMARNLARGRERELAALLDGQWRGGEHGRLVVLRGRAGSGRTTMLAAARRSLRAEGIRVIEAVEGLTGVDAIVAGLRDEFEHVDAVLRLREIVGDGRGVVMPRITVELGALFERIARNGPVALLVDDAARIPAAVLFAARRPGCLVVAAGGEPDLADVVIELGPLPDDVTEAVLDRQIGLPLDDGLRKALHTALGPWFGNPGTAVETVRALENRLVPHRGRLCLRDRENPIGLPAGHELLTSMRRLGGLAERLMAAVAARGELDVDELPPLLDVLGGDLAACGRTLDLLVGAGVLVADGFRVRPVCPALATTVLELAGGADVVHTVLASAEDAAPKALADHLAHLDAGPRDAQWLVALARDLEPTEPAAALRHYVTALRFGPPCAAVLDRALALTVRTGRYDWLYRIDESWPPAPDLPAVTRAGLRAVSWLAFVHTGRGLTEAACTWFDLTVRKRREVCSLGDAASRRELVSTAEMDLIRRALAGDADAEDLREAGRLGDLATVLEIVLGDRYRVPEHGPVAAYRRLLRDYAAGDWPAALSAARELELRGATTPRVLAFARIFAAEICAVRGESEQAEQWLDDVIPDRDNEALHVWARVGLLWRTGDVTAAVRLARQERRHDGVSYGLDRLLSRAATAGVVSGDRVAALSLLRLLESHRAADPAEVSQERLLLAHAMVHGDQRAAAASIELARDRQHTFDLLVGQIRLGELAEDAGEVLHEAYRLARRVGSGDLRQLVVAALRAKGIAAPPVVSTEFSAVERQVITMVRQGRTNQQIASVLRVRPKTVEIYLTRLLAKTGTRSRVELIAASLSA